MISVVVTLCHLITVGPGEKPFTACFERVVARPTMSINACGVLMPMVADWFGKSRYAQPAESGLADNYWIGAIRCEEGAYTTDGEL